MSRTAKSRRKHARKRRARSRGPTPPRTQRFPDDVLRAAHRLSVLEVLISRDWEEEGEIAHVLVARRTLGGGVVAGVSLVDLACLGMKSAFSTLLPDETAYREGLRLHVASLQPLVETDLAHAAKVVHAGIDYARNLGFLLDPDFWKARSVLDGADPDACDLHVPLGGTDGKPLYVAGPHDDAWAVIENLDEKLGPDGFHFIAPLFPE
jgi:hypothetical protein